MDAITGLFSQAKQKAAEFTQGIAAPAQQSPISPLVTQGGAKMVGMGKEPVGYTSAGGRRLKTRSASKRKGGARKTRSASKKRASRK